jgi:hypothetical protein
MEFRILSFAADYCLLTRERARRAQLFIDIYQLSIHVNPIVPTQLFQ